jgi:hypothetical protein
MDQILNRKSSSRMQLTMAEIRSKNHKKNREKKNNTDFDFMSESKLFRLVAMHVP